VGLIDDERDERLESVRSRIRTLQALRGDLDALITEALAESAALAIDLAGAGFVVEVATADVDPFTSREKFRPSQLPYLRAGKDIVAELFGLPLESGSSADAAAVDDFLPSVTPTRVATRAGVSPPSFYALWPTDQGGRDAFLADLLVYMFTSEEVFTPARLEERDVVDAIMEAIESGRSPVDEIHRFTSNNIRRLLLDDPLWYFQLYLASQSERQDAVGEVIRHTLRHIYESVHGHYQPQYESFLERFGVELRDGVRLEDVSRVLTALAEGLALRYQAEQNVPATTFNLFGLGVLCVINTVAVPMNGTSESFNELLETLFAAFASQLGEQK
jgi:AcrR family transcriptional regulator